MNYIYGSIQIKPQFQDRELPSTQRVAAISTHVWMGVWILRTLTNVCWSWLPTCNFGAQKKKTQQVPIYSSRIGHLWVQERDLGSKNKGRAIGDVSQCHLQASTYAYRHVDILTNAKYNDNNSLVLCLIASYSVYYWR